MKKHTYVKCQGCEWQLENYPDRDWVKSPCPNCHNTRQVIDPRELLCNMCGECMCPLGTHNEQYPHGLFKAEVMGGYDSYHLFDMTRYVFSFCEKCLRQMFIQCKVKPEIYDMDFNNNSTEEEWERDQSSYEYRLWKDNGGHHQAYLNKLCNTKKDCPNKAVYTIMINDRFSEDCSCDEHKGRYHGGVSYKLVPFIPNVLKPYL